MTDRTARIGYRRPGTATTRGIGDVYLLTIQAGHVDSCCTTPSLHAPDAAFGPHLENANHIQSARCLVFATHERHRVQRVVNSHRAHEVTHDAIKKRRIPIGSGFGFRAVWRRELGHHHSWVREPRCVAYLQ